MSKQQSKKNQSATRAEKSIFSRARDQIIAGARSRYTGKNAMKNVANDISMLKAVLNTENKRLDTLSTPITLGVSGSVSYIASPIEGIDNNQRIGRSIKVDRLDMILYATYGNGTLGFNQDQQFRWFVVQWLKTPATAGSTPFPLSTFLNADVNGNATVLSLPNTDLAEDFRIIDQGMFSLVCNYTNTVADCIVESSMSMSMHQTFNGPATTNIADNALFFVCVCLNAFAAGGQCNVLPQFRLWYVDN